MLYSPAPNQPSLSRPFPGRPTTLNPQPMIQDLLEDGVPGFPYQQPSDLPWATAGVNRVYNQHPPNNGVMPYGLPSPGPLAHVRYAPPPPIPLVRGYQPEFEGQYFKNRAFMGFGESEPAQKKKKKKKKKPSGPPVVKSTGQPCSPTQPCPSEQTCRWGKCRDMEGAELLPWGWIGLFAGAAVLGFLWNRRK